MVTRRGGCLNTAVMGLFTLGTDFTSAGGWNMTFDSRDYVDTLTGRVRVNASDDAGLSANVSGGLFEIDNVGGVITLTNPTPGTVINGTVNVTFTGGVRKPPIRIYWC